MEWVREFPGWFGAEQFARRELAIAHADLCVHCERLLACTARNPRLLPIQRYVSSRKRTAQFQPLEPEELHDLNLALSQLEQEQVSQLSDAFARVWIAERKRTR